jgi:hypothetical protein
LVSLAVVAIAARPFFVPFVLLLLHVLLLFSLARKNLRNKNPAFPFSSSNFPTKKQPFLHSSPLVDQGNLVNKRIQQ